MSQENVELSKRVLAAINRRDVAAVLALMDNNVEAVSLLAPMEGGYHGHDGIRRWLQNLFDVFPDYAAELLDEVRDLGDLALAPLRIRGHGGGSEVPVELTVWMVGRWRRGRCVWWRACTTEAEALEAAGLRQ